jgi:hypothetical protein
MSCTITATTFKEYFDRGEFVYGNDLPAVRDKDIDRAIAEMEAVINDGLYDTTELCQMAKHYLSAHFLQLDCDAAESGGQASMPQTSRSADGISESVQIPDWIAQSELAIYATTAYGLKWLMITKPYLDGAVYTVEGATTP